MIEAVVERRMSSAVLVIALASSTLLGGPSSPASTDTWLDRWDEARACLVADAEDVETGVAIAQLLGRDCRAQLDEAVRWWPVGSLQQIAEHTDPAGIATAVQATDQFARELGRRVDRAWSPTFTKPLRLLSARFALEDGYEFAGGVMLRRWNDDEVIESFGETKRFRKVMPRDGFPIANAESGTHHVVVSGRGDGAYEIDVSADAGKHWSILRAAAGTRFLDHWQDPRTRAIEVRVANPSGTASIHRITAQQPKPVIRAADLVSVHGSKTCSHAERHWVLGDGFVAPFGEKPLPLRQWARAREIDCRNRAVLVTNHQPETLERCVDRTCGTVFRSPNELEGRAALADDGTWIYVAKLGSVVGIWTESASEPSFVRLKSDGELHAVTVIQGQPMIVMRVGEPSRTNYELVPL